MLRTGSVNRPKPKTWWMKTKLEIFVASFCVLGHGESLTAPVTMCVIWQGTLALFWETLDEAVGGSLETFEGEYVRE